MPFAGRRTVIHLTTDNKPLPYTNKGQDRAKSISFHPQQNQGRLELGPGQEGAVDLKLETMDRRPVSWSVDGYWMTFLSRRDGNWEIYIMSIDGSHQINLTNISGYDAYPAWRQ